jgi:hypothetical protein
MLKNKKEKTEKQPMKCWLVEIELTSGEFLNFYVSAPDLKEAYGKADGYAEIAAGNENLMKFYRGFKRLP